MTDGQASAWLVQNSATYVKTDARAQWWRLPSGEWVAKVGSGYNVELRRLPASSCNCG